MGNILDQLVQSPKLPLYYERIQASLEGEKDRRTEFYRTLKDGDHVEFINGQVVHPSPVKNRHMQASKHLLLLLDTFVRRHQLGFVGYEPLMISLSRNDYEPDICYFSTAKAEHFGPDQMHFPVPDLVVEVLSPSTEAIDRGVKFEEYAAHGVGEYWLVDPESEHVEQYVLQGEDYKLQMKSGSGLPTSLSVSGFEVPVRTIFDQAENLAALQRIMHPSP